MQVEKEVSQLIRCILYVFFNRCNLDASLMRKINIDQFWKILLKSAACNKMASLPKGRTRTLLSLQAL